MTVNDAFRRASSLLLEIDRLRAEIEAEYAPRLERAATPAIRRRIERKMQTQVAEACASRTDELKDIGLSAAEVGQLVQVEKERAG